VPFPSLPEERVEGVEAMLPEGSVGVDPFRGLAQRARLEREHVLAPADLAPQETRALEHAEVLGDRVQRQIEWLGQIRDASLAEREPGEDRPPGGVGDGGEGAIEVAVLGVMYATSTRSPRSRPPSPAPQRVDPRRTMPAPHYLAKPLQQRSPRSHPVQPPTSPGPLTTGRMSVVATIEAADVLRKILGHLGLPTDPPVVLPVRPPPPIPDL